MKLPTIFSALFGIALASSLTWFVLGGRAVESNAALPTDVLCGPRSLHVALNLLAVPVTVDEILDKCGVSERGVAFRDLANVAREANAEVDLREVSWDDLLRARAVAILFVDGNHYVAVDGRTPDAGLALYDGRMAKQVIEREQLERRWNGETLFLRSGSQPHQLQFETCWKDVGFTHAQSQDFRIAVTNVSQEPVSVNVQGTSCSCTSAKLSSSVIEPGSTEFLDATVSLKDGKGVYQEHVRIESGTNQLLSEIWLCGGRYTSRLARDREVLGAVWSGEQFQRIIYIHDPGDHSLKVDQQAVKCDLTLKESRAPIDSSCRVDRILRSDPDVGKLAMYRIKPGDYRITLVGSIPQKSVAQNIEGTLTLTTGLAAPMDVLDVKLLGRVVVPIQSNPPALLLGGDRNGAKLLTLRENSGKKLRLTGFTYTIPGAVEVAESAEQDAGGAMTLQIRFTKTDRSDDRLAQMLTLRTSAGDINVPVLFGQGRSNPSPQHESQVE